MMQLAMVARVRVLGYMAVLISLISTSPFANEAIPPYDGREPDMSKPVQVFILLGQSNMLGFGTTMGVDNGRSLEHAVKSQNIYPYLVDDKGNWVVRKDVRNVRVMNFKQHKNEWMTIDRANIGPEIGIGWHLGNIIDAPVMILKTCIGNRSLGWDLLPPGTPSYDGAPGYRGTSASPEMSDEKPDAGWYAGKQYDDDIGSAKQVLVNLDKHVPGASKYEVAGFFWWQGDKDMRNATHSKHYEANLVRLIHSLRKDFDAPKAKFVSATLGQTTMKTGGNQGLIRSAKFNLADPKKYPEFAGQVAAVYTNPLSKGGSSSGHYSKHAQTYMNVGEAMGAAMAELLKADMKKAAPAQRTDAAQPRLGPRRARSMSAQQQAELVQALRKGLAEISAADSIPPTPFPMTFTAASITLKTASEDGLLIFAQAGSDRTADMRLDALSLQDQAMLSRLYAASRDQDAEAQAIAGIYMELMKNVKLADAYFVKAGDAVRQKWEARFNPLRANR